MHRTGYEIVGAPFDLGGFRPKVRPEDVAMVCLRDVMACENEMFRKHGIEAYTHALGGRLLH